jgi:hypothetical protein
MPRSTVHHSTSDMIDRYLQAVGVYLPRSQREDILAELAEDLRSQLEDREAELGHPPGDAEIAAILERRGRPIAVAGAYLPQRSLIGPVFFPIYVFVLKIVALCNLAPWLVTGIGVLFFRPAQQPLHFSAALHALGTLWTVVFTQFGVITLIFAVLDRASTREKLLFDWDPRKLPAVRLKPQGKRRAEAIAGVIFGGLGLLWLWAVPSYPFLILGGGAWYLKAAPIWQSVYVPIILLSIAGILENAVTLIRPQLQWFRAIFRIGTTAFSLWIVHTLLQTRTYVLPLGPHTAQAAAATNLAILICMPVTAIGLSIGLIVYLWQTFWELSHAARPVPARLA